MAIEISPVSIKYCSICGTKLSAQANSVGTINGDYTCNKCNAVYRNTPKIIVLNLIEYQGKVLLCKRAIKPKQGCWTLPGGYMENNETVENAAIREAKEETGVAVDKVELYCLFNCPIINQVYFVYRSRAKNDDAFSTEESLESKYFAECDVPWDELSYQLMRQVLDHYFHDKMENRFRFRTFDSYEKCPEIE